MVHQRSPVRGPQHLFSEGEASRAICDRCACITPTTFARRDVPFSDGSGTVKNILVSVCDKCGRVIGLPAQSIPAVKAARKSAQRPIEAQLPAAYIDALDLASHAITASASTDFRRLLVTYFVHRAASDPRGGAKLLVAHQKATARFPEQRGAPRRRLSMKVSAQLDDEFRALRDATELNATEVLKSLVFQIHASVVESPAPALLKALKDLAVVTA